MPPELFYISRYNDLHLLSQQLLSHLQQTTNMWHLCSFSGKPNTIFQVNYLLFIKWACSFDSGTYHLVGCCSSDWWFQVNFASWVIFHAFVVVCWIFQSERFQKILSETLSEIQKLWIQIRTDIMSVLIWVQTVCKGSVSKYINLVWNAVCCKLLARFLIYWGTLKTHHFTFSVSSTWLIWGCFLYHF